MCHERSRGILSTDARVFTSKIEVPRHTRARRHARNNKGAAIEIRENWRERTLNPIGGKKRRSLLLLDLYTALIARASFIFRDTRCVGRR